METSFSRQVWNKILSWLRMMWRPPERSETLSAWWRKAKQATPKITQRSHLGSAAGPWMVWEVGTP
jgi:hypothetical protein